MVETDLGNEVKVQRMRLWSKGEKLRMEMDGACAWSWMARG